MPVDEHGFIDIEVGKAWLAANLDPSKRTTAGKKQGGARVTKKMAGALESLATLAWRHGGEADQLA